MKTAIPIDASRIEDFCRRWRIREMSFFGSVLRDDFGPDSDVDVLVEFEEKATWSLLDHIRMQDELGDLLQRKVDLVTRSGVESSRNWIRRESILTSARRFYVRG